MSVRQFDTGDDDISDHVSSDKKTAADTFHGLTAAVRAGGSRSTGNRLPDPPDLKSDHAGKSLEVLVRTASLWVKMR